MSTTAESIIKNLCNGSNTPSRIRSILNCVADDAKERGMACFWKMKDGSIVIENADGVFDSTSASRFPQ